MNLEAYDTHCAAGQVRAPFSRLRPPGRGLDPQASSAARASPVSPNGIQRWSKCTCTSVWI